MINCIIIDDEPLAISIIEKYIDNIKELKIIGSFYNPTEALETISKQPIDLMFLDIQMPHISGLEFLKSMPNHPAVILTTAHREYALEGYELDVIDYLLKPIPFPRFLKAINKFKEKNSILGEKEIKTKNVPSDHASDFIYINVNKKYVKLKFNQILYIESKKDYVHIYKEGETIATKDTISNFSSKLPSDFLRVHRSFIVNLNRITAFTLRDIEIGKIEIPIGESYKEIVKKSLK